MMQILTKKIEKYRVSDPSCPPQISLCARGGGGIFWGWPVRDSVFFSSGFLHILGWQAGSDTLYNNYQNNKGIEKE